METQLYTLPAHTVQAILSVVLLFVLLAYLSNLNYKVKLTKIPLFGGESGGEKQRQFFLTSARKIYTEGYRKVS